MFNLLFNLALGAYATIYAASHWNDPAVQYYVGTNFVLALWCCCDVVRAAAEIARG